MERFYTIQSTHCTVGEILINGISSPPIGGNISKIQLQSISCPPIGGEILLHSIQYSYWWRDSTTHYTVLLLVKKFYYTVYPVLLLVYRFYYKVSSPPIGGEISTTQYPVLLLAERFYYTLYPVLSLVESMQIEEGELVHGGERQVGKRTCWVAGGQKSRVAGVSAPGVGSSVCRRGREA